MKLTTAEIDEIQRRHALRERQVDLAARFGVSQSHISQIVNGRRRLAGMPTIIRIRRVGPVVECATDLRDVRAWLLGPT